MHDRLRIGDVAFHGGVLALVLHSAPASCATESIEFVAEHLAEIAMDNRYGTLPLWGRPPEQTAQDWQLTAQGGVAQTRTGSLSINGPMIALGASRRINDDWQLTAFVFLDDLKLAGNADRRPLEVGFASGVPLGLPALTEFSGLSGSARNAGLGLAVRHAGSMLFWHEYEWTAGVSWQRVELRDYSFNFQILEGPDAGSTGALDYSAIYSHVTPFLGIAWPREHGKWTFNPHLLAAIPLPRRGVVGHITGPGYDLQGDTGAYGDKPFGDPSLTMGFDITYRPWNLTIDVGSVASQALLEPLIHEGVDRNWLISASWSY
jgi:hypothetical protein